MTTLPLLSVIAESTIVLLPENFGSWLLIPPVVVTCVCPATADVSNKMRTETANAGGGALLCEHAYYSFHFVSKVRIVHVQRARFIKQGKASTKVGVVQGPN